MSRGPSLPRGVRLASAGRPPSPLGRLLWRVALAIALIAFVAIGTYLTRDGYRDAAGDGVSLLDSFYYATVSVTTTGYGDVVPLSDGARLFTTLVVTPVRILFLILVVGTTVELLTSQTLTALRIERWRRRLRDHVIVCGYGTKGRAAATAMVGGRKVPKQRVVIVERSPVAAQEAARNGYNTVTGDASRSVALEEANVASARTVIICTADDESAALITLTVRALNRDAVIVAPAREEENADLLRQAGASSVVLTAGAAGRLLGLSSHHPYAITVLEDLMTLGHGLDLVEREPEPDEIGPSGRPRGDAPIVAVHRDGRLLRFDDPAARELRAGDRLVCLASVKA